MKPPEARAHDLAAALTQPACYPHAVKNVERLETHISWIFLTGSFAYKVKKPVNLGFLDFSTLEARRRCCEDELRLNRRLAPGVYLDVVEIRGRPETPHVGGEGPTLEYAVRMREFPQEALASRLLGRGGLPPATMRAFAADIAAFHAGLPSAPAASPHGTPASILRSAQQNFGEILRLLDGFGSAADRDSAAMLRDWTEREFLSVYSELRARRAAGFIRECHGDLHLDNIVMLDDRLVPFDCIEFSHELRSIDVMSEVAFITMDLLDRGVSRLAWLFINDYLEATGDYAGLAVLRFYLVYRAMVRAKVHLLRAEQCADDVAERGRLMSEYRKYILLAARCTRTGRGALVLMHGFSGCGKSSVALELAQAMGAVRIRSDAERKRLHGLRPLQPSGSAIGDSIYVQASTEATYARLAQAARDAARAGYTAIVDATFLRRPQRACLRAAAQALGIRAAVVDVHAPIAVLRSRVAARAAARNDPSEATVDVLESQIGSAEPISAAEELTVVRVDGRRSVTASAIAELGRLLRVEQPPGARTGKAISERVPPARPCTRHCASLASGA